MKKMNLYKTAKVFSFALSIICVSTFCVNAQKKINMTAEKPENGVIKIMSYNIHHAVGMDKKLDCARIGEAIKMVSPDVVALQEVDSVNTRTEGKNIAAEIADAAGMGWIFGASIPLRGGSYGNAILFKQKPLSYKNIPLPGRDEARAMLIAEFKDYYFCSVHLSLDPDDRAESARIICETAKKMLKKNSSKAFYVAGDFNELQNEIPIRLMINDFTLLSGQSRTFPADNPDRTIDYIFVYRDKFGKQLEKQFNKGTRGLATWVQPEKVASDHRPVIAAVIKGQNFVKQEF